jgi:hypothetical protein
VARQDQTAFSAAALELAPIANGRVRVLVPDGLELGRLRALGLGGVTTTALADESLEPVFAALIDGAP